MSAYLFADAMYKGVLFKEFTAFTFAPFDNNKLTTFMLLNQDARCKGVSFISPCASMSAPLLINSCIPSVLPILDAMCKGVFSPVYFLFISVNFEISFVSTLSFSVLSMYFIL